MAESLPSGTVTFLFTDVEGSTRLLDELGVDAYAVELGRHRTVVRAALSRHGGVEVDTQGDAFFCAFGSARSAVTCATDITDALTSGPIRLRIGVHTGEALVVDRHYVGMEVHRAARIGACGHGGQVILSPTTVGLLTDGEFALRELGSHRLKDLAAPVVLHQLGHQEYPPLKSLYRTNLPVPATDFLGREQELGDLVRRAAEPGVRLLTLTGTGGTGKTRLVLQLAAEISDGFPDGIWWIPLAPLRQPELLASAVATVLGVEEEPGQELTTSIAASLARRRTLLVIDNCEHLVDSAATLVAAIVAGCPDVVVLATSREALAVSGEHVFTVPSLVEDDAVELFHARSHAAGGSSDQKGKGEVVRRLCARLDNLPLAVELAAARSVALPPATLLERLSSSLDLLKGPRDVDERQRTLRATIAWSHGLLEEPEQQLFRRLAVFAGGGSLDAIEAICDADLDDLLSLVSKSLVRELRADSHEPRYWMLETIREFAVGELRAAGELDRMRDRHARWYAARLPAPGSEELLSLEGAELARIELDLANLRAAFAWSAESGDRASSVVLAAVLWHRHSARGRYLEAEEVARRTLGLQPEPLDAAYFHDLLGVILRLLGRPAEALDSYLEGEQFLGTVVDRDERWWARWIDLKLDQAHFFYFENDQAGHRSVLDELEPAIAQHGTAARKLDLMHAQMQFRYRLERYALSEETEELARTVYELDVASGAVSGDFALGFCLLWRRKLDEAELHLARGLDAARNAGLALFEMRCLVYGLLATRLRGDREGVRARLAALEQFEELHGYLGLISSCAAWLSYRDGDFEQAANLAEQALAEWGSEGRLGYGVFQWTARFPLLGVALDTGDTVAALGHAQAMLDPRQQPLPEEIAAAVESAVTTGRVEDLRHALEVAQRFGYA